VSQKYIQCFCDNFGKCRPIFTVQCALRGIATVSHSSVSMAVRMTGPIDD